MFHRSLLLAVLIAPSSLLSMLPQGEAPAAGYPTGILAIASRSYTFDEFHQQVKDLDSFDLAGELCPYSELYRSIELGCSRVDYLDLALNILGFKPYDPGLLRDSDLLDFVCQEVDRLLQEQPEKKPQLYLAREILVRWLSPAPFPQL